MIFRHSASFQRRRYRGMATDAAGECCISLLRQDKARQAKTGQDCLFVSRPPFDPQTRVAQKRNLPYRHRVPRGLLVGSDGRCQRKGDSEGM